MNNRLILVDATLDDRSSELARAIHSAGEFEWYFGFEETPERLEMLRINKRGYYNILDVSGNFIGYGGVHYADHEPEVELYIIREHRRKGYAKEALSVILAKAFYEGLDGAGIQKLVSSVRKKNIASQKLMESCGFEKNEDIGFCMLVFLGEENDDAVSRPVELEHYYITREMFEKRSKR